MIGDVIDADALTLAGAALVVLLVGASVWAALTPTKADDEALRKLVEKMLQLRDEVIAIRDLIKRSHDRS